MIITFNDGVSDYEDIDIDISDVALNMTAPSQIAVGYTSGEEMEVIEGQSVGTVQTKIYSAGALKDCTLITQSTALLSQGWPAEIDLFEASPEQLSLMTSLGLKLVNFNVNAGAVYVDFTKVIPFLEYSANEEDAIATFSVVATDKYSKPAKEASILMVKSLDNNFGFSLIENVPYEVTTVTGTVQLNGDINVISYQQLVNGNWQPIQISSLTKVGDSYSITLNLASPADDSSSTLQIKAICGRRELIATSHIEAPVIHAEVAQVGDVWSSKAVFTVENISPTTRAMNTNYVSMEYYTHGEWIKPTQTVSGIKITVTGL